jgi:hypothetical protein
MAGYRILPVFILHNTVQARRQEKSCWRVTIVTKKEVWVLPYWDWIRDGRGLEENLSKF